MKVAFVHPGFENLGIEYLSAVLKQHGHTARLFFDPTLFRDTFLNNALLAKVFAYREKLLKRILDYGPDVIAFSVVTVNYQWACDFAARIKEVTATPIVFGGNHVTSAPEEVISNSPADYLIRGEGEYAFLSLVETLGKDGDASSVQGVWSKHNGKIKMNGMPALITDLDQIPFPDKELFYEENSYFRYGYLAVASRGCSYNCSYCSVPVFKRAYGVPSKEYVRLRSVANVVEEVRTAKEKYGIHFIRFCDDTFPYQEEWLAEFAQMYPRFVNVPFWIFIRPDVVTEKNVKYLKAANCVEVEMGVQSTDEEIRNKILLRPESNERIKEALAILRKEGIRSSTDNLLSLPTQEERHLKEMADFYLENRTTRVNTFWVGFLPNTDIVRIARQMGLITDRDVEEINRGRSFKSLWAGGSRFNRTLAKYQNLFLLINLLPVRISRFIVKKGLYRYLPYLGFAPTYFLTYGLSYFQSRHKNDIWAFRLPRKYIHYMLWRFVPDFFNAGRRRLARERRPEPARLAT